MGLFSRRKDKTDKDTSSTTSNGSLKPVKPFRNSNGSAMAKPQIPDIPLPKAPDPALDPAGYLRSIYAVRDRTRLVLDKAKANQLNHFNVDMSKLSETAAYVVSIIKVRLLPVLECPC